jgi:hypothetical protein
MNDEFEQEEFPDPEVDREWLEHYEGDMRLEFRQIAL